MKEKLKLTELTKEELRQVTGGVTGGGGACPRACPCKEKQQQSFGLTDSMKAAGSQPIMMPR